MSKQQTSIFEYVKANTATAIIVGAGVVASLAIAGALAFSGNSQPVSVLAPATNKTAQNDDSKMDVKKNAPAENAVNDMNNQSEQQDTAPSSRVTGNVAVATPANVGSSTINQAPVSGNIQTVVTTPQPAPSVSTGDSTGSTGNNGGNTGTGTTPVNPTVPPVVVTPTDPVTPPALCNAAGVVAPLATVAPTATTFDKARVSLTFDDGWRNIYTGSTGTNGAYFQLKDCGLVSTQYLNSTPVIEASAGRGYEDYMTYDMVKAFKATGNELAWHTRDHADLVTLTPEQMDVQLTVPQEFLTGTGTTAADYKNFATPYGSYSPDTASGIGGVIATEAQVKAAITRNGYATHRSVDEGYNTKSATDFSNVKVQNVLDNTTPAQVQAWIQQAVATNSWLVLVYHEVGVDRGVTATEENYTVSPENLALELSYIKQSGITVQTVEQALTDLRTQL